MTLQQLKDIVDDALDYFPPDAPVVIGDGQGEPQTLDGEIAFHDESRGLVLWLA